MTENLSEKVDLMKREIDALQITIAERTKPWYKNASTILSVAALLFSFGTTYVSYSRTAAQDVQGTRQELRGMLQRLAALPKENVELGKKYPDDPVSRNQVSGFLNQENSLLARQAAELARKLPADMVTGDEYIAVAVALRFAYDLEGAAEFLRRSIKATKNFNTEISALRMTAELQFIQGHAESARAEYQEALDIFSKYQGYDPFTTVSTNVCTELDWAIAEAGSGSMSLANEHVDKAETLLNGLSPSPGAEGLKAQVLQVRSMFTSGKPLTSPTVGSQLGVAPPPQSIPR